MVTSTTTPAEVGGLWVPANPEHAKIGWSYDFEQTERIARAAYDSTGYDATMEVVEFVMAEADRRHAAALAAKDAELAAVKVSNNKWLAKWERAEAQLAEARKALERIIKVLPGDEQTDTVVTATNRLNAVLDIARRVREAQGGENGQA